MDIRVYNKNLTALGLVDEMESLIWTIRYFQVGEVKLQAPMTPNNKELLKVGNLVVKHDEYIDYVDSSDQIWRRMMEITYIRYSRDEQGKELIEATGSEISGWLNQRVIYPQLMMTGTSQEIANFIVNKNIGPDAGNRRKLLNFSILSQADLGGSIVNYSSEELKPLGDEVRDVCQGGKIGYDIFFNERTGQLGFYVYKGKDLTADNAEGNDPCIFSRDFDNVRQQEFEDDTTNISNYAYVKGAEDSQGAEEIVAVDPDPTGAVNIDLKEIYIDASDIQRSAENAEGEQEDIPVETYRAMLATKGNTELAKCIEAYTFNSSVNLDSNIRYKEDFDIGDRVTCVERSWGVTINSRITEITQTFEKGLETLEVTFGESAPSLLDKIKKVR